MSGYFLLEDGVDLTIGAQLSEVLSAIQEHTSVFVHQGFNYHVAPVRGNIQKFWTLEVLAGEIENPDITPLSIGLLSLHHEKDHGVTRLQIPPWSRHSTTPDQNFDFKAELFTTFLIALFQLCQRRGFIDIPAFGLLSPSNS